MSNSPLELDVCMVLTWETIVAHALTVKGREPSTYFNKPTVKANGRALISPWPEPGSFVLHIDLGTKILLREIDPDTFGRTPITTAGRRCWCATTAIIPIGFCR